MRIEGRLMVSNHIIAIKEVDYENPELAFTQELSEALILLCKELSIPVPMWLSKNTKEFAHFHSTYFEAEQFYDQVNFDRFLLKLLEM